MNRGYCMRHGASLAVCVAMFSAVASAILWSGSSATSGLSHWPLPTPNGTAQLISYEASPQASAIGEMCQLEPASATASLISSFEEESAKRSSSQPAARDFSKRKPVRMIRDPYAAYSSVAVDPISNEVVLTDENL